MEMEVSKNTWPGVARGLEGSGGEGIGGRRFEVFGWQADRVGGQWEIHGVQSQIINEERGEKRRNSSLATKGLKD